MQKRQTINTIDPSLLASREAIANLDPLLQPIDDQNVPPIYSVRKSSLFYNPSVITDEGNSFRRCFVRFSGIFYSLMASFLFTSTNFLIKQLDVVPLDVFFVRFIFQGLISLAYILYKGYRPYSQTNHLLIFIRSLIAASGSLCFYLALSLLPLPDLTTLRYTQVVWTALLALMIFRERITIPVLIASLLTLIGVVFVAQPSFLFNTSPRFNETVPLLFANATNPRLLGMLFALVCAFSISAGIVLNKKLLEQNVRQSIIMFHFILTTFFLLLVLQIYSWVYLKPSEEKSNLKKNYFRKDFIYATILATLQLIPMVLSQKSIKREHPSIVTVVQASDILFAILFQNLFSTMKSNGLALIGSTLVLTSIVIVGGHKLWQDRQRRTCLPVSIEDQSHSLTSLK